MNDAKHVYIAGPTCDNYVLMLENMCPAGRAYGKHISAIISPNPDGRCRTTRFLRQQPDGRAEGMRCGLGTVSRRHETSEVREIPWITLHFDSSEHNAFHQSRGLCARPALLLAILRQK